MSEPPKPESPKPHPRKPPPPQTLFPTHIPARINTGDALPQFTANPIPPRLNNELWTIKYYIQTLTPEGKWNSPATASYGASIPRFDPVNRLDFVVLVEEPFMVPGRYRIYVQAWEGVLTGFERGRVRAEGWTGECGGWMTLGWWNTWGKGGAMRWMRGTKMEMECVKRVKS